MIRLLLVSTTLGLVVTGTARNIIAAAGQPNIITVFIDDMGYTDLSCFGGKRTVTQNIDRLASEGIRFTNFYVNSPICSPSRTALTTGQYPQRWQIHPYLADRQLNIERGVAQWLNPDARELQSSGYATGHFGKWHMGGQRDAPLVQAYGFDRSLTNFERLGPRVLGYKNAFKGGTPDLHDLGSDSLGHGPIQYADRDTITGIYVKEAIEFIDHAQTTDQPFFVNLWPDDVHSPFFPPKALRDKTNERKLFSSIDINRSIYTLTNTSLPDKVQLDGENVLGTILGKARKVADPRSFSVARPIGPDSVMAGNATLPSDAGDPEFKVSDRK